MQVMLSNFNISVELPNEGQLIDSTRYAKSGWAPYMLFAYSLPHATLTGTRGKMEIIDDIHELVNFNLRQILLKGYKTTLVKKVSNNTDYYVLVEKDNSRVLQTYFYFKEHFYSISATFKDNKVIDLRKIKKLDLYHMLKDVVQSIKKN
ncbi:MAG: hypothetical protein AB7S44_01775 [Spirochaetales bacterium]